ncbi:hypothetical protein MJO47_04130 [Desulfuromonas sp. KJ2020]|uniref:hypothetical protein n=1 Tax=Desulfuromonas sp. KJ2020 TaxID=2919173 RepID=UPI000322F0BA|nr:hypothetical protein [Desulfuromonas sp. KJ2020]MCP3176284.1 hypothetical protein [Desulfuromonas sp. KJ2020]
MRTENIITDPIKTTYKYGVYSAMGFVGLSLAAFIAWSFTCAGGALVEVIGKMV